MNKLQWSDVARFQARDYNVGDEIYSGDLFLGIIEEIEKPWFERPYAVMSLASYEAKKFMDEEFGLDDPEFIKFVPAPFWLRLLRKTKRLIRSLRKRASKDE